ncbi:MAG: Tex family protein [Bacteroidales bacterium]|nr:Tex family protein [Bacteroidales bacterium]
MLDYATKIALGLNLGVNQVAKTIELLEGGATVPFIARYRKEMTGNLNEVQIAAIRAALLKLKELDGRREAILQSIEQQGKMTASLKAQLNAAEDMTSLEDLYLPYRPKRKTRASVAVEKGLEPLADNVMQGLFTVSASISEEDLQGARDIIAERMAQDISLRNDLRHLYRRKAILFSTVAKGKEKEAAKYRAWHNWKEPALRAPSHRVLAMLRGQDEGLLHVHVTPDDEDALALLQRHFVQNSRGDAKKQMALAAKDCYTRLLAPSMENEILRLMKENADKEAIRVFAENLRQLLLASPLGQKRTLAIDPGFRTGCKCVCLDAQGQLLHHDTIYPFTSVREEREAIALLEQMVEEFDIEAIAIGNGTAGRETEEVVKRCHFKSGRILTVMVSESGASIYSASEAAREEFPDYDITVRGAVSIGRRLMDPLSELVKIDPKSIGVGQYQHDVNQKMLQESLEEVVESCVNSVGVELNTASPQLLSYVSGIGPVLARRIVNYRDEEGAFPNREALKKVKGIGPKAFEQCAGFLRVHDSDNPLDRSAVHPERYPLVEKMAQAVGSTVEGLINDPSQRNKIDIAQFVSDDCGLPTLQDIMKELEKPGRDPRTKFEVFEFDPNVTKPEDLKEGMVLPGIVTNITAFGAFVDVGVHQDGLVHISQLSNRRVNDPNEVVRLHQHVKVKVLNVDLDRNRISLSMKAL